MNIKINTMNKFNLNALRNDVIDHVDLPATLLNGSSFWKTSWIDWILSQMIGSESSSYVTSWIDFIIEALIGSDYYAVMIRNPLTTIRFDFRGSHQVLNMAAYPWAGFEDII